MAGDEPQAELGPPRPEWAAPPGAAVEQRGNPLSRQARLQLSRLTAAIKAGAS